MSEHGRRDEPDLNYVVNGGFSRWHAYTQPWTPPSVDSATSTSCFGDNGPVKKGDPLTWVSPTGKPNWWQTNQTVAVRMGCSSVRTGTWPWDYQHTRAERRGRHE